EIWLDGDPGQPPPPQPRKHGRNLEWRHVNNADVISMPDTWEYPWYAAWDLAFHCVALAHVDPALAKDQLLLMCREWYMHPNGQLPAYEWAFGDVNPPVHAWAALKVFEIDARGVGGVPREGDPDHEFLERIFHKLLLNFTWWVNRKDAEGRNVFEGGFLGLDNIGPLDRSAALPVDGRLQQSDGTAWMGMFCLNLLEMSLVLAVHDEAYEDMATKFFEHFAYIASAIHDCGLWDEEDGFYYDVLLTGSGERVPLRVRSMVGVLPLAATITLGQVTLDRLPYFAGHMAWFLEHKPAFAANVAQCHALDGHEGRLLSFVSPERLRRLLATVLDPAELLAPHGLRALAASHWDAPFSIDLAGMTASVDYEPGESTTGLFGGNSNWRGPIWFPVNYLVIEALGRFGRYFGDDFTVEHPTGSGIQRTLTEVADDLAARLISIFLDDESGRRPVLGGYEKFQTDPALHDMIPFHEYFHGDTGQGLGASHQTGWTGLVADLISRSPGSGVSPNPGPGVSPEEENM
ncbi:MAG TPA: glucosidase, partial [Acidimicrobiia bacterium]